MKHKWPQKLMYLSRLLSKNVERSAKQALGILLGAQREALEGCGGPLEGSWEAFGKLLQVSKKHLGPKTVIVIAGSGS